MKKLLIIALLAVNTVGTAQQIGDGVGVELDKLNANTTSKFASGYYSVSNGTNFPPSSHSWSHFVTFHHSTGSEWQLQICAPYTQPDNALYFRTVNAGNYNTWQRVATENSNTFKDAQYFPGTGVWSAAGKVGIGTNSPTAMIDIIHASSPVSIGLQSKSEGKFWIVSQSNQLQLGGQSGSQPGKGAINILYDGRVAIGTNSFASSSLYVLGDNGRDAAVFQPAHIYGLKDGVVSQTSISMNTSSSYNASLFKAKFLSSTSGFAFTVVRDNQLNFSVDHLGAGFFRSNLTVNDKIGIGTTASGAQLSIYGNAGNASMYLQAGNGSAGDGRFWIVTQNNELQIGGVSSSMPAKGSLSMGIDGVVKIYTKLEAQKIEVKNLNLSDFVFADDYKLRKLSEVEAFIGQNSHLPEVPSAAYVAENGMDLTEMTNVMLMKIEELTLYLIEQDKKMTDQDKKIAELQKQNERLLQTLNK